MINFLVLFVFSIITLRSKAFQSKIDSFSHRGLSTWSSISSCSSWNSQSSCAYFDGIWTADTGNTIAYNTYDQSVEYQYWNNAVSSGYIQFDSSSLMSIDLSAKSTANSTYHSLCEWKIVPYSNLGVTIKISRNSANYEDLYVYYNTSSGSSYYTSKNLANWDSSSRIFTLKRYN